MTPKRRKSRRERRARYRRKRQFRWALKEGQRILAELRKDPSGATL